ncbi:MAG: hypothetical protein D6698_09280 [Gammaproteobacteria bacterium]|nr:MAG: hypothetical protein D6698_09280 [Gammaproteobacteria bacterium]
MKTRGFPIIICVVFILAAQLASPGPTHAQANYTYHQYQDIIAHLLQSGAPGFSPSDLNTDGVIDLFDINHLLQTWSMPLNQVNRTPTPDPSVSNPSLVVGTGIASTPDEDWLAMDASQIFTSIHLPAIEQALSANPNPALIYAITNASATTELISALSSDHPNSLIQVIGTGNNKYNGLTHQQFTEHFHRSTAVLALSGSKFSSLASHQTIFTNTQPATLINAGYNLGLSVSASLNPNQQNLIILSGPGHRPNLFYIMCGVKAGIANLPDTSNCSPTPDLSGKAYTTPRLQEEVEISPINIPNYVHIVGGPVADNGVTISTAATSPSPGLPLQNSILATTLSGNFQLASIVTSLNTNSPAPQDISLDAFNQAFQPNQPLFIWHTLGHPAPGTYTAVRQAITNAFPNTAIFGLEAAGEYGHLSTSTPPNAYIQVLSSVGIW